MEMPSLMGRIPWGSADDPEDDAENLDKTSSSMPPPKKTGINRTWTPAEEQRLKVMRDAGNSWGEIAKTFPNRTEGSVKKHWYKDMHYADFAEDDSAALLAAIEEYEASRWKIIRQKYEKPAMVDGLRQSAILAATKDYEASKWKIIGQKLGKPAEACEQYAKENFGGTKPNRPVEERLSLLQPRYTKPSVLSATSTLPGWKGFGASRKKKPLPLDDDMSSDFKSTAAYLEAPASLPQISAGPPKAPFGKTVLNLQADDSKRVSEVKTNKEFEPPGTALSVTIKDSLGMIESQVLHGLSFWASGASLKMQWNLLDFISDQYVNNEDAKLGSVIALSGTVQKAQATTCSEYVECHWPSQGSTVIRAFQSAIDSRDHKAKATNNDLEIGVYLKRGSCFLFVQSKNPKMIVGIFQQAIWMGTALRTSRNEQVQYSSFCLAALPTWGQSLFTAFSVTFDTSELSEDEQSCWLPLFANPVIAQGFPVSEREHGERGLEVPLEIMAALGGARHVTDFQGGLVLKGHSAIFVPVTRHHLSIQWHLIQRSDEQRVLYREVIDECPKRAMLKEVDHESLRTTRAFLGWWKNAETHLGTADAAYNSIDWSPAGEARRPTRFSGASLGFQTMITGQLNFVLGAKDGRLHFSQKGPFQRIVQCAEKTPVVLYDLEDCRAWLVPALDVMLHIVQTRHHSSPYNTDGKNIELTPVDPENGRRAATEAVAANELRQLHERDIATGKDYYYKDAMLDIWSQMERLMEKEDSIEARPGLALHGTMQRKVHGWEYMSLVNEKNYKRKEAIVEKSSGGWVDLVNDIDALILFATGFGEIIKPASDLGRLCDQWRSLPKSKDYLAASVPMMELLYSEAGSRLSHKHLSTTHLQWHRGSTLFEQCFYTGPYQCRCDRTQQIYHDSSLTTFGRVRPPGKLEENGCVIFGQVYHSLKRIKKVAIRENAIHMLPNTSIQDSVIATNVSTPDDGIQSPSPPASFSPEREEVNGYAVRSPKRPPSPMSSDDELVQGETIAKRRCDMSHVPTTNFDPCKGPNNSDDQSSDDNSTCPLDSQSMLRHDTASNEQYAEITETVRPSKAEYAPVHALQTIRHKANIENYSHRHGCTCTTCSTIELEPPDSIELFCTTNGSPITSTTIAERRQHQPV